MSEGEQLRSALDDLVRVNSGLEELANHQRDLVDAARRLSTAEDEMTRVTATGLEALEAVRTQLREHADLFEDAAGSTDDVLAGLRKAGREFGTVAENLVRIDPAKVMELLDDHRRDLNEHGVEVREVRRQIQRVSEVTDTLKVDIHRLDEAVGKLDASTKDVAAAISQLRSQVNLALVGIVLIALVSTGALIASLQP